MTTTTLLLAVLIAVLIVGFAAGIRALRTLNVGRDQSREAQARALVAAVDQSRVATRALEDERARVGALAAPSLAAQTVVVQTRDGLTIRGVLVAEHADRLYLKQAVYVESSDVQSAIGGTAIVLRSNVSWLQLPSAPAEA